MTERALVSQTTTPTLSPAASDVLRRACACGNHSHGESECAECKKKREVRLQRAASSPAPVHEVPPIVHEVLRSPGQPLDVETRAFMEPRFGRDFSNVRIHSDSRAADSAQAVDALAYTVGRDVVFDAGQYQPTTSEGRSLIAHELTHTIQQSSDIAGTSDMAFAELEAKHVADQIYASRGLSVGGAATFGSIQRQTKSSSGKDKTAQDIIDKAKDATKTPDIATRAKNVVWDILKAYYSSEVSKVSDVVYEEDQSGLETTPVGSGSQLTGKIAVGKYFVEHIDSFARRVLQVGHELQHVDQHRTGKMSGAKNRDEREFLAFEWEANQQPKAGTGRLGDAMRRDLIDCALGYLLCLPEDKQKGYDSKKAALLKLRDTVNGTSGNPKTDPPDACKRCNPEKKKSGSKSSALEQGQGGTEGESATEQETRVVMNEEPMQEQEQAPA